jgi:hypothetical protein
LKHIKKVLVATIVLTILVFVAEMLLQDTELRVMRNTYGEGKKIEEYELTVEDEIENEKFQVEVEEQRYTSAEVQQLFHAVMDELDTVILGANESFNRIETDLNLVARLADYPVDIQWDLNSYEVMSIEGEIREEKVSEEGTLVRLRGTLSYGEEQTVYVRNIMVFPPTRDEKEQLIYDIQHELKEREAATREEKSFQLPEEVNGKKLTWSRRKEQHWYYILLMGVVCSVYLVYRDREKKKKKAKQRREELIREYPGMISKFTMLLGTGTTVKNAWEKIVQNYELQKEHTGKQVVYEEMLLTYREMQGGVSEMEAYEKFGKRCGVAIYMKFGAMLAQNLRKGSKGILDILRMEAIQSFENRKSTAKRLGEEAGTKLLMPMLGMLMVVLVMVMVPAFLTMQL